MGAEARRKKLTHNTVASTTLQMLRLWPVLVWIASSLSLLAKTVTV